MTPAPDGAYKPMSLPMKVVLWLVLANAALGALSLLAFPTTTERTFFWKITPPVNASMFGVLYVAAGLLVLYAVRRGQWEPARVVTVMVPCFTGLLLLTTLLHRDRFVQDGRFYYWLAVYLVAPVAGALFYVQHERSGANWQVVGTPVSPAVRRSAIALGALAAVFVVLGYLFPEPIAAIWPWPLTPLMVRVFLSWVSALAAGLLWFGRERDWGRLAPVATMLIIAAALMLVMLVVYRPGLQPDSPGEWLFGAVLVGGALLGMSMHWAQRGVAPGRRRVA